MVVSLVVVHAQCTVHSAKYTLLPSFPRFFPASSVRCCSSSDVVFRSTRRGAASRRVETDVHGERSKRRRGGRQRGELTGSQQVTASPSFYYLLSLSRSSGYSLSFPPPPSTLSDSPPRPSIFLDPFVRFLCVYFRLAWIVLQVG